MKKVVYIYERPFTIRDYHRFGADYLEQKGYSVEIWIIHREFSPKIKMIPTIGKYKGKNMYDLTWYDFIKRTKKNKDSIFILFEYDSLKYMMIMGKYHCDYFLIRGTGRIMCNGSSIPKAANDKKNKDKINYFIRQEYQNLLINMAQRIFPNNLPKYAFLGVEVNEKWEQYLPSNRRIYIHSFDYDRFLETKLDINIMGKYIIYIDSGFGNMDMNELVCDFNNPWRGKTKIWDKLEKAFDKIEEYYQLPIIVAGHPHTKYKSKLFCKRKIIFNRTPELVANSKFVIMQWSTTISLALLFKKNVLVLIDNDFKKVTNWNNYYNASYKYFGITPCNMDTEQMLQSPWKYTYKIDERIAQKYIDSYVKMPGTPNKFFIEVVEEKIQEIETGRIQNNI